MRAILATTALVLAPMAASAVTVSEADLVANSPFSGTATFLAPGGTGGPTSTLGNEIVFEFTATENLTISDIELFGLGESIAMDGMTVSFRNTRDGGASSTFTITDLGFFAFGAGTLPGFDIGAGEEFSVVFERSGPIEDSVAVTIDFGTLANAVAVPLPAGAPLMLLGLGALYAARRRAA